MRAVWHVFVVKQKEALSDAVLQRPTAHRCLGAYLKKAIGEHHRREATVSTPNTPPIQQSGCSVLAVLLLPCRGASGEESGSAADPGNALIAGGTLPDNGTMGSTAGDGVLAAGAGSHVL